MRISARSSWLAALLILSTSGCGGGTPAPVEPEPAAPAAAEPAPAPEPVAEVPAAPAEEEETEAPPAAEPAAEDPDKTGRDIKYVVAPAGLEITVAGVQFVASATAIRVGGGWGVRVKTKASARDGKEHQLLAPKRGPLAFAGSIERGGQSQRFGDKREGEGTKRVGEDSLEITRDWPGDSGEKPLRSGDKLMLEVGLWGLGDETPDSGRPVKQFFVVKMNAGKGKPDAIVQPPEKFQ